MHAWAQVCGSYYQGRGQHTHAFTHALETGHHMFMKLEDGRVYCLPDGYEVEDRSLDPIRYVLNPTFAPDKVLLLIILERSLLHVTFDACSAECMGDPGPLLGSAQSSTCLMHSRQRILK